MPLFTIKSDKPRQQPDSSEFSSQQSPASSGLSAHYLALECGFASGIALVLLAVGTLLLATVLGYSYWQEHPEIIRENGLLEDGQVAFLALACTVSLLRFWRIRLSESLNKVLFLALAFSTLIIFLREVDIDKLGSSPLWPVAEKVIRAIVAVTLLGFIFSLLKKMKLLLANLAKLLKTPLVILVIIGALFYACSWPLDKNIFSVAHDLSQFCEEMIELNACILFAFAALACGVKQDKPGLGRVA